MWPGARAAPGGGENNGSLGYCSRLRIVVICTRYAK